MVAPIQAVTAYNNIAALNNLFPTASSSSTGFAEYVGSAIAQASEKINQGDKMAKEHIKGNVPLLDMVTAVNEAEITLKTLVGIRDKFIAAYQDIAKMPV